MKDLNKDKNKYETEFSKLLKNAIDKKVEGEQAQIDLSFLDKEPECLNKKKRTLEARKRALKVAAIVVLIFTTSLFITVSTNSTPANAIKKGFIENMQIVKGYFTNDEEVVISHFEDGNIQAIKTDDLKKIGNIQNKLKNLPIPGYVPEGYTFDNFSAEISGNEAYNATYKFTNGEEYIYISIYYNPNINNLDTLISDAKNIKLLDNGSKLCIWEDQIEQTFNGSLITNYSCTEIIGAKDQKEILEIAKNLK